MERKGTWLNASSIDPVLSLAECMIPWYVPDFPSRPRFPVTCLKGEVFDVAIDLRRTSPTFLRWHAVHLGADNHRTLAIPEGFAHGFQTLTDNCELIYLHTAAYHPEAEAGLNALDPRIAINWPRPVSEISVRDRQHALLDDGYTGIRVT